MSRENRTLKRTELSILHQRASCHFYVKDQKLELAVLDFHHKGACLSYDSELPKGLSEAFAGTLDFYVGKKQIHNNANFKVAWINEQTKKIGIKFEDKKSTGYIRQEERFSTSPDFAPTVFCNDPLDANRSMFFSVRNFSVRGVSLTTSLTNRYLLPGMTLAKANITFPNAGQSQFSVQVMDVRQDEKDKLQVGCKILESDASYAGCLQHYFNIFGPLNEDSESIRKLFASGLITKKIKAGLNFRVIDTEEVYEQLLHLRYRGYKKSKKVKEGHDHLSQGEGLKNEGFLGGAYLKGKLIGSFELRFGDEKLPFRLLKSLSPEKAAALGKEVDLSKVVEISKLVIDPDYQGTDIVLGMMQKMANIVVARGQFGGLATATENLVPLYEKVGFKPLNYKVPHPVLKDTNLVFVMMNYATFAEAKNINPILWDNVYRQSHENFVESGIVQEFKFNWRQKLLLSAGRIYLRIKEKTKRRPTLAKIVNHSSQKYFAKNVEKLEMLLKTCSTPKDACKVAIDFAFCNTELDKFVVLLPNARNKFNLSVQYSLGMSEIQNKMFSLNEMNVAGVAEARPSVSQVFWTKQGVIVEDLASFRQKHGDQCFQELEWSGLESFMAIPIQNPKTKTCFGVIVASGDAGVRANSRDFQLLLSIASKLVPSLMPQDSQINISKSAAI